jgi:predicted CXXCH cytochrome family protein
MHVILMITCFILSVSGMAAAGVVGSKHDFSILTGSGNFAAMQFQSAGQDILETCVFCHTPHSAASPASTGVQGLLWNRTNSIAASFDLYTSSTLSTEIVLEQPSGLTLMCMGCHDGISSIAVGTLVNPPNPATNPSQVTASGIDKIGNIWNVPDPNPFGFQWGANIGNLDPNSGLVGRVANLADDHPVAFEWVYGIDQINDPADWGPTELKLFNNRMECSTCHDVHDNTDEPFLRMPNINSDMCTTCHAK